MTAIQLVWVVGDLILEKQSVRHPRTRWTCAARGSGSDGLTAQGACPWKGHRSVARFRLHGYQRTSFLCAARPIPKYACALRRSSPDHCHLFLHDSGRLPRLRCRRSAGVQLCTCPTQGLKLCLTFGTLQVQWEFEFQVNCFRMHMEK